MSKGYISHGMKVDVDSSVFGNTLKKTIVNVVHYLHTNNDSRFIKLFLKWDENRGPTSLTLKAKKYAEEANLPFKIDLKKN